MKDKPTDWEISTFNRVSLALIWIRFSSCSQKPSMHVGMLHVHACVEESNTWTNGTSCHSALPAGMLHGRGLRESLASVRSNYLLACGTGVLFSCGSGIGRPPFISES